METLEVEPDVVQADEYLEQLPGKVVENIRHELSKNGAWLKIAKNLESVTGNKLISDEYMIRGNSSPARELLQNLMNNYFLKVEVLQKVLKNCQLYDILRIINTNDPVKILEPVEDSTSYVPLNAKVKLHVDVCGSPFPQIQWYFEGNPLTGETSPVLVLGKFSLKNVGEYTCKIRQRLSGVLSELTSHKYILNVMVTSPTITVDLKDVEVKAHEVLTLSFEVDGYPEPKCFTWFRNKSNIPIAETAVPQLIIPAADIHNADEYYCRASGTAGYCTTRTAVVKVQDPMMCPEKPGIMEYGERNKVSYTARNKWALVIGNSEYQEMSKLPGARNDIEIIRKIFTVLGFRVLVLSNLKRAGIQNGVKLFSSFIQKGDYVSFFYAGHGMHNDGKDYIIPLDAKGYYISRPQNVCVGVYDLSIDECISNVWITNVIQERKPALIFSIHDTCRNMKPKFEGYQPHSSQNSFQIASGNFYSLFATSENYTAFETKHKNTSLLVETLQNLMTYKVSVQQLCIKVLQEIKLLEDWDPSQVPKICGDLTSQLSLTDRSQPQEIDKSEYGVLKRWEQLACGRRMLDMIVMPHTKVEAIIYWNIGPHKDGVTWVISNYLQLIVNLSQDPSHGIQEMDVDIKLQTGQEVSKKKLRGRLSVPILVPHLEDLENRLLVELYFTYKGHHFKKEMLMESPAISQWFFEGNHID